MDKGLMAPDWAEALAPVDDRVAAMGRFLREEIAAGRPYLPSGDHVFRAFRRPLADVRVLIVGQDPYPTPGHPIGLCFAVDAHVRPIPRSLANIYQELATDVGVTPPPHGDLTAWSDQGVMLLNRVLTVQPGLSASHRGKGWEHITACAISAVVRRAQAGTPIAAIPWVESAHPSPLSASRGFFGSRPFSRVNELLVARGGYPVDWSLPLE
jgi:uracil-DNA glycosylase